MNNMIVKELEVQGCKTFVCPNLSIIDEKGKELSLKDKTIKRARDLAITYFKATYHRPHYSSAKHVLPAFIYITSILEGERKSQSEVAEVFNMSCSTIRKWYIDVVDTLGIKVISDRCTDNLVTDSGKKFVCPNLDIIDNAGNALDLEDSIIERAKDLAVQYFKKTYISPSYRSPQVILPSCIYLASILENNKIRQIDICTVSHISESSISRWYKDIADILGLKVIYGGDGHILKILCGHNHD